MREGAPQPPEAGAGAVFVNRLHVHVPLAGPGCSADDLRQECLRGRIAVQDAVLAALLVVDHELHGDARLPRPARIGWGPAVTDEGRAGREGVSWPVSNVASVAVGTITGAP